MPLSQRPETPAGAACASVPAFLRFALSLLLLAGTPAGAAELTGLVIKIADGDTITVLDSSHARHKIRLEGIDAPERHQAFGGRSKEHLAALVAGRNVTVIWHKHDRYGRILGRVLAPECGRGACPMTLDTGLAQLNAGLAWHYRQYAREQEPGERRRYAAAEQAARAKQQGLWHDADPVPPWDYRRASRHARTAHATRAM